MKKIFYLLVFVSSLCMAQVSRTSQTEKSGFYVSYGTTRVIFNNRYLDFKSKVINDVRMVNCNVYGDDFSFKIYDAKKIEKRVISDVSLDVNSLEIKIVKNKKIVKDWFLINQTSKELIEVNDIVGNRLQHKTFEGYVPYKDSLVNGDKLDISFRQKGKEISLIYHFIKKVGDIQPYCLYTTDIYDAGENVYLDSYFNKDSLVKISKVNKDLQGKGSLGRNTMFALNERVIIIFRNLKSNYKRKDFEYRITINDRVGDWKESNGIIPFNFYETGMKCKLEVRYKDHPKNVSVYTFSSEPSASLAEMWVLIIFGSLFLLLLSFIYIFWTRKVTKKKRLEQKSKVKMLYAQLNPHFVFNALGSIQGLLNDNQIEKANQYLAGFGSLLRNTLVSSESETQNLEIEIKSIKNYIELEQLRNPFSFRLVIDEKIDIHETQVLPLLMQPLIENAIKHGISNKENAEIALNISKKGDDLIFELVDNGKGFNTLAEQKGFGLKLVKDRITLFNQSSKKMKIDMKIQSDSSGTQITVCYKNWLKND